MSLKEKIKNIKRKDGTSIWEMKEVEEIIPDELEYNEKGLIKRDGFRMGSSVHYGKDFEEENFSRVFKMSIVGLVVFFILFAAAAVFVIYLFSSGNFKPFFM